MSKSSEELTDDENGQVGDLFHEPDDFYEPEKPATFTEYSLLNGDTVTLRLVGHSPLWGHLLWNAGKIVARYIEDNRHIVKDKNVLELGAGAGLPSIVAAVTGARKVVVTDYPEAGLIQNLQYNIEHCTQLKQQQQPCNIAAEGYLWGNPIAPLTDHLNTGDTTFDLLILADIVFNHSEHVKLALTVKEALKRNSDARALVFFTPYRPHLLGKDMQFFDTAREHGFVVNKLLEHKMDTVMFENDPGDEDLRRTVFGFELKWPTE